MNPINAIIKKIKDKIRKRKENIYIIKSQSNKEWVYICYISQVFYHLNETEYLDSHQNKREAIIIASTFHKLGYNVYVQEFSSSRKIPNLNFKIIFGIEPNFCKACKKFPHAKKIYYATGAYFEHQNKQIRLMTDYINTTYNAHLPYKRLALPHNSIKDADYILQIGSSYTIETYPKEYRHKISLIHQSIQTQLKNPLKNYAKKNEFFYMGSGGNALKGLSLLIEYFHIHPELYLNVVGPIEDDFHKALSPLIGKNIKFWGFLNVNSQQFCSIIEKCNFIIYPSGSEGGIPGAVINSMKRGLIPIVTPWSAFDGIEDYGFLIKNWDLSSIDEGIKWSQSLTIKEIEMLSRKCQDYATKYYNLENFKIEFTNFIQANIKP